MRLLLLVLPFILAIVEPTNARANEIAQRQIIQKAVASAFINGRFDELDTMADQFRTGRERTESGVWKLTVFYSGFNYALLDPNYSAASFDRFEAQTLAWIKARPNSPAAKIAYALALSERAWFLRGGDYYNKLTDEQRLGYVKYLRKRRDHLLAIKEEASKDPHWYALMVLVAMEESWPDQTFDRLVAEAAEREPYYYQTYFFAIDRNLPQWGGSEEKMNAVVARATDYTRELDGDSFKARGYWYASSYGRTAFDRELLPNWSDVAQGFQDLVSRYPDQWNLNAYAKFSCLAKDRTRFLVAYSLIKVRAMAEVWDYPGQDVQCAAWAMHPEMNIEVK
ncbi:hypothetical protein [Aminobacter aminovorans]|uniref:hypothetical protein n=1 Tax=Aminobacter aminovorans TaxID=83263 RepID=UPI00285E1C87|nr:hypothetical protein [Aminobacter aminovorans]MDR7225345.1 hypothetical protein [Aminobacter aminovorans]